MNKISILTLINGGLVGVTACTGLALTSISAHADNDSVTDEVDITVPVACTMTGTITTSQEHTATLQPGTYSGASGSGYENGIGKTTLATHCNDYNGFSIYAIGFTGETEGNNTLVGTSASGGATIPTKVYESTDTTSSWSMKVTKVTDSSTTFNPNNMSITNSFDSWHTVPDDYTKVAEYHASTGSSATDQSLGAKVETTYASYISTTQPADTYTGKVKYVMVHPYDHTAPVIPDPVILDTGRTVNSKLKSVAATVVNGEETVITQEFDPDSQDDFENEANAYIESINIHTNTPAPVGFTPTEMNTISSSTSTKPIYIIFDNTDDAGIMHLYTEGSQIVLPADSSFMFYNLATLSDLPIISDWDATNVTNMSDMFANTGWSATTFALDLSSWDTTNVTDMSRVFYCAGLDAHTWSVGDLSTWNTDNVTDMSGMFYYTGPYATTWSVGNLSSWNTENVTDMSRMFYHAGYSAATFELNLSSWNTANVTEMDYMFDEAGYSATTWSVTIPQTNGGSISNTTTKFYGQTTSVYSSPDSGKSFTLAQPQP